MAAAEDAAQALDAIEAEAATELPVADDADAQAKAAAADAERALEAVQAEAAVDLPATRRAPQPPQGA